MEALDKLSEKDLNLVVNKVINLKVEDKKEEQH